MGLQAVMFPVLSKHRSFIMVALLALIGSCNAEDDCIRTNNVFGSMHAQEISLLNDKGKIISFESMVADSSAQRAQGFQHICESVIDSTQILFVYSRPIKARFHMRNVKAPLDIGFFDSAGKLVGLMVMNTYDDGNRRLYSPNQEFQYALEGHVGFFSDFGMSTGKTRLVINSIFDES